MDHPTGRWAVAACLGPSHGKMWMALLMEGVLVLVVREGALVAWGAMTKEAGLRDGPSLGRRNGWYGSSRALICADTACATLPSRSSRNRSTAGEIWGEGIRLTSPRHRVIITTSPLSILTTTVYSHRVLAASLPGHDFAPHFSTSAAARSALLPSATSSFGDYFR